MKKTDLNKNIYLSTGNKKLMGNDSSYYLIWNLPAVTTCPYATDLCIKSCYAKKAERLYPQVLPCREMNYQESLKDLFVKDMIHHIDYNLSLNKNKDKQCYFRIHESGDMYSLKYLINWTKIATAFPKVKFLAYTKSVQFISEFVSNGGQVPKNLTFRYSVWDDTNVNDIQLANSLKLPIYTAFTKDIIMDKVAQEGYYNCLCKCQSCKVCYSTCSKIAVTIH